jgi:hypothetical protein
MLSKPANYIYEQNKIAIEKLFNIIKRGKIEHSTIYKSIERYYKFYNSWCSSHERIMCNHYNIMAIYYCFMVHYKLDADQSYDDFIEFIYTLLGNNILINILDAQDIMIGYSFYTVDNDIYLINKDDFDFFYEEKKSSIKLINTDRIININDVILYIPIKKRRFSYNTKIIPIHQLFLNKLELNILIILNWNVYFIKTPITYLNNFYYEGIKFDKNFIAKFNQHVIEWYKDPKLRDTAMNLIVFDSLSLCISEFNTEIDKKTLFRICEL